jgi:hypothetical protein
MLSWPFRPQKFPFGLASLFLRKRLNATPPKSGSDGGPSDGLKGQESIEALALAWVYIFDGTALKGRQKIVRHEDAGFRFPFS